MEIAVTQVGLRRNFVRRRSPVWDLGCVERGCKNLGAKMFEDFSRVFI